MTAQLLEERLTTAYEQLLDSLVDPRDAWCDDDGSRWMSLGAAGEGHDCVGVAYRSETELAEIRTQCRALAVSNEYAINGHENRINYIVGFGHRYRARRQQFCHRAASRVAGDCRAVGDARVHADE
ncbi:MAG: hypothetical protein JNM18_03940 [Planctomycetaceae bacterium]|nr:hypothetical protein [Planctomycetaceae bacterium]